MNWYKLAANIISFDPDTMDDVDYDQYDYAYQADKVFQESKIRYDSTKNLSHLAVEDGVVIGAVASGWSKDSDIGAYVFAFDVVVKPEFRGKSLAGLKLISEGISRYNSEASIYRDMGYNTMLKLWVVNPRLVPILERKYNLEIESKYEDGSAHMIMY